MEVVLNAKQLSTNELFAGWRSPRTPSTLKLGDIVGVRGRSWRLALIRCTFGYLLPGERVYHKGVWWAVVELNYMNWLVRVGETRAPLGGCFGPLVWLDQHTEVQTLVLLERRTAR